MLLAAAQIIFAISHESSLASHSSGEHLANIYRKKHNSSMSVDLLKQSHMFLRQQQRMLKHATAHAQTCQTMSGYDLSNIFQETETKHVSRPLEARSKVIATATVHAQTCQNMSGDDLSNIYQETEIKHVSRPPEARSKFIATATVHAQTCQNMSGYSLSNISVG